jgi:hypothetical protein
VRTHDPKQVIEDLRNHLAAHDRRLAFLFGAGTSSAVNIAPPPTGGEKPKYTPLIPTTDGLTKICAGAVAALGEPQASAWKTIVAQCKEARRLPNAENVLSNIRMKIEATVEGDSLVGLSRKDLCKVEKVICSAIAKATSPAEDKIPGVIPHDDLAGWVKKISRSSPLEIFTTNYDVLFERAFETSRVPVFDGFVGAHRPFFFSECLDDDDLLPSPKWVRLWKLHGSVNWRFEGDNLSKRIVRSHLIESGELILPSYRKYDESRKQPYMSYMDRLSRIINSEHSLLITCGFSFADEHINALLYGALDNRSTANVIVLWYDDLNETEKIIEAAVRRSNLTVIGPNGGVISGTWGTWQLTQPVDKKTHPFMDSAFDSNALPEDEGSPAASTADLRGRMRLGNFVWFCRFLKEMGPVTK